MVFGNFTELIDALEIISPLLAERVGQLILILQALGIALIAYVVYAGFMLFYAIKRSKKLDLIENNLQNLDLKVDSLLKKK